jgi:hypothetical protein
MIKQVEMSKISFGQEFILFRYCQMVEEKILLDSNKLTVDFSDEIVYKRYKNICKYYSIIY